MFHCSTISLRPSQHQMVQCFTISVLLFHCSTISFPLFYGLPSDVLLFQPDCSTVIRSDVLFHHLCFTVPPLYVPLFHYLFYCSTIRCFTVALSDVLLFHHQMFHFSTMTFPLFHHQMFYCSSTIVALFHHLFSTVSASDVLLSNHQIIRFVKPQRHFIVDYHFLYSPNVG